MSRSGYSDDCDDPLAMGRWRQAVNKALRGKRGQAFLKEMLATLDAMPDKRLIGGELVEETGGLPWQQRVDYCALGAVGQARGVPDLDKIDPYETERLAATFGIAESMVCEIAWHNDEGPHRETPEQRWQRVRTWVASWVKD